MQEGGGGYSRGARQCPAARREPVEPPCCCACRPCSCAPCARTRPTPRCRATGCWSGPATSAASRRASTPGCRWASWCCANVEPSCARRWPRSAPRRCTSRRCCRASRTRRAAAGPSTATTSSASQDRKGADYLLGPTHEEMFTLLVKDVYSSYKDFPVTLFQIQTKYRDEARPRAGILRGREFVMKDSYSFDLDDEGLQALVRRAPRRVQRIFDRLGLDYMIVSAMSGAMGGSRVGGVPGARRGRRGHLRRLHGLRLRGQRRGGDHPAPAPVDADGAPPPTSRTRPDTPTIDALVELANAPPGCAGRTGLDRGRHAEERGARRCASRAASAELLVVGVPGDREVDLKRVEAALSPGRGAVFEEWRLRAHPALVRGYIGPQRRWATSRRASATWSTRGWSPAPGWLTGAERAGPARRPTWCAGATSPPTARSRRPRCAPATPARACGGRADHRRGASRSGTSSSSAASTPTRSPSTCSAETASRSGHDGLVRHRRLPGGGGDRRAAPRRPGAGLAARGRAGRRAPRGDRQGRRGVEVAAQLAADARGRPGVRVLVDDRTGVSPGVKFTDAELIGIPPRSSWSAGPRRRVVELRDRGAPASARTSRSPTRRRAAEVAPRSTTRLALPAAVRSPDGPAGDPPSAPARPDAVATSTAPTTESGGAAPAPELLAASIAGLPAEDVAGRRLDARLAAGTLGERARWCALLRLRPGRARGRSFVNVRADLALVPRRSRSARTFRSARTSRRGPPPPPRRRPAA